MTPIDRAHTERTLHRVAICAFLYYPGKPDAEPGYTVDEDVDWCLAPLSSHLPGPELDDIRGQIRALITDPLADRRAFVASLAAAANEG
jgi:hypothetical protein